MASLESASDAEAAINTSLCGRPSPFRMSTGCTAFAGSHVRRPAIPDTRDGSLWPRIWMSLVERLCLAVD